MFEESGAAAGLSVETDGVAEPAVPAGEDEEAEEEEEEEEAEAEDNDASD